MKTNQQFRKLTDTEVANCIKLIRESRGWSQETLSEVSQLSLRTIQRVEKGEPSNIDTRRSLARAFDANNIDAFNSPTYIPSEDDLQKAQEDLNNNYSPLETTLLKSGGTLLELAEKCHASVFHSSFSLNENSNEDFLSLRDLFQEYNSCSDLYSSEQKTITAKESQEKINKLKNNGVSLVYSKAKSIINSTSINTVYIIAFPINKEPDTLYIPNKMDVDF
jgi:transcriptional regulator with XRE-family HTH domain